MANAKNLRPPWKPGESGNPKGKPKGTLNLSTVVKDLMADPKLMDKIIKKKPDWWPKVKNKRAADITTIAMIASATGGDHRAYNALRKAGWGDKLDLRSGDRPIKQVAIFQMTVAPPAAPKRKQVKSTAVKAKKSIKSAEKKGKK